MLIGMPIASTMDCWAPPKKPMVIPWLLNSQRQCISLKTEFKRKSRRRPESGFKPIVDAGKAAGQCLPVAMTFPPGTHGDVDAVLPGSRGD